MIGSKSDRVAESAASRRCHGEPAWQRFCLKSLDYTDSWEVSTNISGEKSPRQYARGSSSGALNSAAWLRTLADLILMFLNHTVLGRKSTSKRSPGVLRLWAAMVGNTGLAIYYPTDQLVPIINLHCPRISLR